MSNVCHFCGKRKAVGGSITRKGLAKKAGGIGMHVVKNVKRTFEPNLQTVRISEDGQTKPSSSAPAASAPATTPKPDLLRFDVSNPGNFSGVFFSLHLIFESPRPNPFPGGYF